MADAFYGEIRLLPYTFVPANWLPCDGRQLLIQHYQVLYAVIGRLYGGDGQTTFNLPNLQGRTAVGYGDNPFDTFNPALASSGGAAAVTLTGNTIPPHTHTLNGVQIGQAQRTTTPAGNMLTGIAFRRPSGTPPVAFPYDAPPQSTGPLGLNSGTLTPFTGGSTPHENRQPALALRWCICVQDGYFPSRP
ncbi:MAG: phage tail protein [Niveispirillum sp.]|uniref:phage tail protein n=1 Tax=Niveispirillum sp. TaxID=1917217 RepID=UPI003BA7703B